MMQHIRLESLITVSYTHLDVYKRQGLYYDLENLIKVIERFGKETKTSDNRDVVFAFVGAGSVLDKLVSYVKEHHTVSYTHLERILQGVSDHCLSEHRDGSCVCPLSVPHTARADVFQTGYDPDIFALYFVGLYYQNPVEKISAEQEKGSGKPLPAYCNLSLIHILDSYQSQKAGKLV